MNSINNLFSAGLENAKYNITHPSNLVKNVGKVAIPALALYAASNASTTEQGPITYWSCVVGCEAMCPAFIPLCITACFPLFAAPTP